MLTIKNWESPKTLDEAFEILNLKRSNKIIGGGLFLRMARGLMIDTAVDLSRLSLDRISENENSFEIGAMVTLRQLETNEEINSFFKGYFRELVGSIVGVQLRNIASIGGTVYARYGFSDIITGLLALETKLLFYKRGEISLEEYLRTPVIKKNENKDILTAIKVSKNIKRASFKMLRNSSGDFAILNAAVSFGSEGYRVVVGGRPQRAELALKTMERLNSMENLDDLNFEYLLEPLSDELIYGTNRFADKEYRRDMSKILVKKAFLEVANENRSDY